MRFVDFEARFSALALVGGLMAGGIAPAMAAPFDFVPAPQTDLNRIYRIDRFSGEISSCQYGLQEGTIGVTLCFGSGEGAGPQVPGEYGLVASRHEREGGVFRVNFRTGDMSICYVFDEKVVCTPQTSPAAAAPASSAPAATPSARPGTGASPQRP
ncbi:hypothetical protein [Microvirga brassicacearum]|uniref:Uncharacterized protein n=1 Tax=Microvirga brassicacearum TaxID=2580413 RepID=A0A5N3P5E9_9HYPH|nr:hypothetical protein FEZ63_20715 [Microvirga brassicacearum]